MAGTRKKHTTPDAPALPSESFPARPPTSLPDGYGQLLDEIKQRISAARVKAALSVNRELIALYWDIGRLIVQRQQREGWGRGVIEQLGRDIQVAFPGISGFSPSNLWRMRLLYIAYSQGVTILAQAVRELSATVPWGHHVLLLGKIKSPPALLYYLRATAQFGWSRNVLLNQIKASAYERAVTEKKTHNFPLALPEYLAEQADEMLKSSYSTAVETAGGPEGKIAHGETACGCRA